MLLVFSGLAEEIICTLTVFNINTTPLGSSVDCVCRKKKQLACMSKSVTREHSVRESEEREREEGGLSRKS